MAVSVRVKGIVFPILGFLLSVPAVAGADLTLAEQLLDEAGLIIEAPADYQPIAVAPIPMLPHEIALESSSSAVQVRYAIRPIDRMEIDYEDPHNAAPDPNHIFPMLFSTLVGNLSDGRVSPTREFSEEDSRQRFNADWASLALFDLRRGIANDYDRAFLLAVHRNHQADAFVLVLFNSYEYIRETLDTIFQGVYYR